MMTTGRPRTFDAEDALDAAITVFWSRGYDGASLDELTRTMGMNKSSLYRIFGSKEGLFGQAIARYVDRDLAYARRALEEPTAALVARSYLHANVAAVTMPGRPLGCMSIHAGLSCGPESAGVVELLAGHRRAGEAAMAERFSRAVAEGDLDEGADPEALARYLNGIAEGNAVHAAGGTTEEQLRRSTEIALGAFRATAPPASPTGTIAKDRNGHDH